MTTPPELGALDPDGLVSDVLIGADELQARIRELAAEISRDYADRDLLLIGVLKGAVFFLGDLMRQLTVASECDFMAISSYGSGTESSGVVRILKDLDASIEGRNVLVVEDIVDSGLTLSYLLRTLEARGPKSLEVVRAPDEALAARGRPRLPLRRLRDPEPLRDRLRARLRRALPQPAVRRGARRDAALSDPQASWAEATGGVVGAFEPPSGSTVIATVFEPLALPSSPTTTALPPLNVPAGTGFLSGPISHAW